MSTPTEMQQILALARRSNASDIHIVAGLPPLFRINGEIILSDAPPLQREDAKRLCYSLLSPEQEAVFERDWQICCSVFDEKLGRFRVSIYYQAHSPEMALRPVSDHIKDREELNLPLEIEDLTRLASGLGVNVSEISQWRASYRYAPSAPRKARLVTQLIAGRSVQDALDVLKFEHKRAARMIEKVLKSAIANADEAEADVEKLYVSESRVDGAGRRIGTKTWIAKDRGRAHPIRKEACHIHIAVAEE